MSTPTTDLIGAYKHPKYGEAGCDADKFRTANLITSASWSAVCYIKAPNSMPTSILRCSNEVCPSNYFRGGSCSG